MNVGAEIKKARIDRRMKQKTLYTLLGITPRLMSDIEQGKTDPRFSIIVRIADILQTSLDTLAGRTHGPADLP